MTDDARDVPPIDLPPTQQSLPIAMIRAREKLMGPIRDMLQASGLTEQQWRILRVLEEYGPQDATKLAERSSLLMPSQTRIVQNLSEKGLVSRKTSTEDRRRQVVTITPEGRSILVENAEQARAIAGQVRTALGDEKVRQLLALLDDIVRM
ncbi:MULTISPECIES: homoprotocatechuate degradation operon regulator HpaR [unclassified Marinovum]